MPPITPPTMAPTGVGCLESGTGIDTGGSSGGEDVEEMGMEESLVGDMVEGSSEFKVVTMASRHRAVMPYVEAQK